MIEIWERVRFKGRQPVSWERSTDFGHTWEEVAWPTKNLPFVRLDTSLVCEFTTMRRTLRADVPCIHAPDFSRCPVCQDSDATGFV